MRPVRICARSICIHVPSQPAYMYQVSLYIWLAEPASLPQVTPYPPKSLSASSHFLTLFFFCLPVFLQLTFHKAAYHSPSSSHPRLTLSPHYSIHPPHIIHTPSCTAPFQLSCGKHQQTCYDLESGSKKDLQGCADDFQETRLFLESISQFRPIISLLLWLHLMRVPWRNVVVKENWFYHDRSYNLIAAC